MTSLNTLYGLGTVIVITATLSAIMFVAGKRRVALILTGTAILTSLTADVLWFLRGFEGTDAFLGAVLGFGGVLSVCIIGGYICARMERKIPDS